MCMCGTSRTLFFAFGQVYPLFVLLPPSSSPSGIYFAEHSSKSNQYVYGIGGGNGCPEHKDRSCYTCIRFAIIVPSNCHLT